MTANQGSRRQNGVFRNTHDVPQLRAGLGHFGLLRKFLVERTPGATPSGELPVVSLTRAMLEAQRTRPETQIYRLGHSTVLFKFGSDFWITDPVFSMRASPSQRIGPKRFHPAPIQPQDLPDLKGVIISHNHYDHLDRSAIKRLTSKVDHFITPLGLAKTLVQWGVDPTRITELDWWQSHQHGDVKVTATPSQHFSGRGIRDTNKTLWASFALEHQDERLFFGSDSGYFDGFSQIARHFGPFALTLLESGAYSSAWPNVHMTPEQTIQAHIDLQGAALMPIHNATFKLSFHPWKEPLERLSDLAAQKGLALMTPRIGARSTLGQPAQVDRWWQDQDRA